MKIQIINAMSDLGVHIDGSRYGGHEISKEINNKDIKKSCIKINHFFKDKKSKIKNLKKVNRYSSKIYNKILKLKTNNIFPILLGGDHSVVIGSTLANIKYENKLGIIWIDSHSDYNTINTTVSGNIHGMPLSSINNKNKNILTNFHNGNYYNDKETVIIGARDIDNGEKPILENSKVKVFTTNDIHNKNIKTIIKDSIEIASNNTNGIYISCDLDVLDPTIAPGVSIPASNGITEEELLNIIDNILLYKDKIVAFDIVEYNPKRDINNKTKNIAVKILKKVIASKM